MRTSKQFRDSATSATGFCGTGPAASARSSGLSAEPDAKTLIAHVEHSLGDLLVNCLGSLHESVINVVSSLCTGLQEYQAVFLGESLALFSRNLPLLLQIALVTDEHDGHVVVRVLPRIFKPRVQVIEGLPPSHIVDEQRTSSTCWNISVTLLLKAVHL